MELELQNVRQEVARVGHARRNVVLRARIEVRFTARGSRRDALIFQAQVPPRLVVLRRRALAREDLPPPLVDQEAEGQERDLLESLVQQQTDVLGRIRRRRKEPELDE